MLSQYHFQCFKLVASTLQHTAASIILHQILHQTAFLVLVQNFRRKDATGSRISKSEKKRENNRKMAKNKEKRGSCNPRSLVGVRGFEPPASWSRTKRSTKLSHTPCMLIIHQGAALVNKLIICVCQIF